MKKKTISERESNQINLELEKDRIMSSAKKLKELNKYCKELEEVDDEIATMKNNYEKYVNFLSTGPSLIAEHYDVFVESTVRDFIENELYGLNINLFLVNTCRMDLVEKYEYWLRIVKERRVSNTKTKKRVTR